METQAADILRSGVTRPFDLNINVFDNTIDLEVASLADFNAFVSESRMTLPDTARIIVIDELAKPAANIYAGLALSSCTSGFSISKNSSGTKGITTAGHCTNSISYSGTNLPYQPPQAYSGSFDVQWHTAPGFTVRNYAYDGISDSTPYYRVITGKTSRSNQAINDFYCKYGKVTNYGCGYLISKTRAPGYVPNVNATFMELHRDGINLCSGGDSGGPIFTGAIALGLYSGCAGSGGINNIFYMAINYAELGLGVTVPTS